MHRYARLHADPLSGSQPTRLTHEGRIQYISADYMADAMLCSMPNPASGKCCCLSELDVRISNTVTWAISMCMGSITRLMLPIDVRK